jgi:crotonobetaine/carnitine-CoA ligase
MPKGAVLSNFAFVCAGHRYVESFQVRSDDRHLSVLMLFHVGGLMFGLVGPLVANIPSGLLRWFSASNYWDEVRASGATIIDVIGPMISVLCKAPPSGRDRDHTARVCLGAVGQVAREIPVEFERRFGITLLRLFAQTEAGGINTIWNPLLPDRSGSVGPRESLGRSNDWAEVMVVDEYDQPVANGERGEIVLRQRVPFAFMSRYFNNDAITVATFRNGLLHTGDVGYLDEGGWLFFVGRQAHWIRRRGENISAFEVEALISRYPGVREVGVVGVQSEIGEEDVQAVIACEPHQAVDPAELVRWCQDKIAAFKIPRFVQFVDELPRSTTKREVLRHLLKTLPRESVWDSETVFGRHSARGIRLHPRSE